MRESPVHSPRSRSWDELPWSDIAVVIGITENRLLAQENSRIQEMERKHPARELHDELGQYLNAIKLDSVSIRESGVDAEFSSNAAHAIIRAVDRVHGVISDMIGRLRPVGLDELGLVAAIEHCVDHWRQHLPEADLCCLCGANSMT
jgi:two-component system, NarL family, sensor histidine kinase UhpB